LSGRISAHENFLKVYGSVYREITDNKATGVGKKNGILYPKNEELYKWVFSQVLNDKDITNNSSAEDVRKKIFFYLSGRMTK
jgi:hypothetical protein